MSLGDFLYAHIHSTAAASVAAFTTAMSPVADWISRAALGITVGVFTWLITKTISMIIAKLRKPCSKD